MKWITKEAVERVTGWSSRTIEDKAQRGELKWRYGKTRARNHKLVREYDINGLPPEAQAKILRHSHAIVLATGDAPAGMAAATTIPVTAEAEEQIEYRMSAILPLVMFARGVHEHDGQTFTSLDGLAQHLAETGKEPHGTLWRWYRTFKKGGRNALADRIRRDKGQSTYFTAHPELAVIAADKYLNDGCDSARRGGGSRLSVTLVHQGVERAARERGITPPSYNTTRAFIEALAVPVKILSRQGRKAFNEACTPFRRRNYVDLEVMEWVTADTRRSDVFVIAEDDSLVRLQLTALMDVRSRMLLAWIWSINPNWQVFASVLRMALSRWGTPRNLLLDNGLDFKKAARLMERGAEFARLLDGFGVAVVDDTPDVHYALPFNAQAKPIESMFSTMSKRLDPLYGAGYAGRDAKHRSEWCRSAEKEHKRCRLEGNIEKSPFKRAAEFIHQANYWIEHEYNRKHRHSGHGMNGRTPWDMFQEGYAQLPEERRQPRDPMELAELFWDQKEVTVREGGCIQLNQERYEPANTFSLKPMCLHIGRKVIARFDPYNPGEAVAYDTDGRPIGVLCCQQYMSWNASKEEVQSYMRDKRTANNDFLQVPGTLRRFAAQLGVRSDLEELSERAGEAPLHTNVEPPPPPPRRLAAGARSYAYIDDTVDRFEAVEGKK